MELAPTEDVGSTSVQEQEQLMRREHFQYKLKEARRKAANRVNE